MEGKRALITDKQIKRTVRTATHITDSYNNLSDVLFLGKGKYGCVFKTLMPPEHRRRFEKTDGTNIAVKISLELDFTEQYLSMSLSLLKTEKFLNPFVVTIYDTYRLKYTKSGYNKLAERLKEVGCEDLGDSLQEVAMIQGDERATFMEMQLFDKSMSSLLEEQPYFLHTRFDTLNLIFQLIFSLYCIQRQLDIIHGDLHYGNLLVQFPQNPMPMTLYVDPKTSFDFVFDKNMPILAISDFGLAKSPQIKGTTLSTFPEPVNVLLKPRKQLKYGPQIDVNNLGLALIAMSLADWKPPKLRTNRGKFMMNLQLMFDVSRYLESDLKKAEMEANISSEDLFHYFPMAILQHFLGNGIVPSKEDFETHGFKQKHINTELIAFIEKNKELLLDLGKDAAFGTVNVIEAAVKEFKSKSSPSVFQLVKSLCAWFPFEGKTPESNVFYTYKYLESLLKSKHFMGFKGDKNKDIAKYGYFEEIRITEIVCILGSSFGLEQMAVCQTTDGKGILWDIHKNKEFCNHKHPVNDLIEYLSNKGIKDPICPSHVILN